MNLASLPWKPVAALPHCLEPTPILIAAQRGFLGDENSGPWVVGLFEAHGLAVIDRDNGRALGLADDWVWCLEDELLESVPRPECAA